MNVNIKRVDSSLPLPQYATSGSVGFDLYSREDVTIESKSIGIIPANVIIETPPGYVLILASRSSTPKKKGLLTPHGIGIIDQDYSGEGDELKIQVYNFTENPVTIEKGERIAQGLFVPAQKAQWSEQEKMGQTRGGFGSTG